MAGGNKKKKKPAANPARGFATTSIASKAKPDDAVEISNEQSSEDTVKPHATSRTTVATGAGTTVHEGPDGDRNLHDLSPEELEAQLEASELQQFVEKYAAKTKKESSRQVSRLQTDKRLLRGQADLLSVRDWLPEELMQQILDLTLSEIHSISVFPGNQAPPLGDDLTSKIWQLRQCLVNLTIPLERVNEVLGWILTNPPTTDTSTGLLWGLDDCLDWLAMHCESAELDEYDSTKPRYDAVRPNGFHSDENLEIENDLSTEQPALVTKDTDKHNQEDCNDDQIDVSEVESDLEPDELRTVYLRTKTTLFTSNPETQQAQQKKGKATVTRSSAVDEVFSKSASVRKLEEKLQRIESDILFDKAAADAEWVTIRTKLVREAAERRRLRLQETDQKVNGESLPPLFTRGSVNEEAEKLGQELIEESENMDDDNLLGGMFDALPGLEQPVGAGHGDKTASDMGVSIRDFGRLTGLNPKRVFEEACKARDSRCRLSYKLVSPTTYASRQAVSIQWTKAPELLESSFISSVRIDHKASGTTITMTTVATPDVGQSEAYVATAALFIIFSGSAKEEKAHLRLPSAYRDLWDEFVLAKSEHIDKADREAVKEIRTMIDLHCARDDDNAYNEVVFNANSRRRLNGTSGTTTPVNNGDFAIANSVESSQQLKQMWMQKIATPSYQRMLAGRMSLPMFSFRSDALEIIQRNQVTILCGETGCGKSTQLPAFILEHQLSQGRPCKIYCTEPRRISAISLAQRVSEEMGENKGDVGTTRSLVGYAIRLESQTTAQTRLVYATTGIVLRMLENSGGLNEITHLVIDEVHERSIDTDFLLIILRTLMVKRPDLKVVLMSATVDAQKFSQYLDGAPIINVPGRTFPVEARFLEDAIELTGHTNEDAQSGAVDEADSDDGEQPKIASNEQLQGGYSKKTIKTLETYDEYRIDYSLIIKLLEKVGYHAQYQPFSKATLVFLPGIAEIRQLNDMLLGHPRFGRGWQIHPLHSSFSSEDQQAAFVIPAHGIRKIVLATNIAETGITIPDITCVIDTGKHKEMRFDERRQMSRLIQSFIARANAKQRRGRAGRMQEGICFHLFTRHRHDELMVEQQTPEMLRLSLQDLVMRVKICRLGDIETALSQALDPPSGRNIRRAIDALVEVGALTSQEELTPLGTQLAKLPLDAQLGKLILLGSNLGCLDFALTAAAALSSKSPFLSPMHAKKQADSVRLGFKRGNSDLLTLYNAYSAWRKICNTPGLSEYQFCNKNFLSPQNLANIEDLKGQLLSALLDTKFVTLGSEERSALAKMRYNSRHRSFVAIPAQYSNGDSNEAILTSVIAWSFYPKVIRRDGKGWRNISNNQSLGLHPTSVNKVTLGQDIKFLSFYSIMQSSSRFTNAQETSPVPDFALVLMTGEAVFHMYAGVIVIDGNRLRFKVRDWKTMIVIKSLRLKLREVMAKLFKNPGRALGDRPQRWMDLIQKLLDRQQRPLPIANVLH